MNDFESRRRRTLIRFFLLLLLVVPVLSGCDFATPGSEYVGVYGHSNPYYSGVGVNALVAGVSLGYGGRAGVGIYGTPLYFHFGNWRYLPRVGIKLLPFVHLNKGIQVLVFSVGI